MTGAGGFIGGRAVEMLHGLGLAEVRAGVRRWSTAARIGRLPVEIVPCDVLSEGQVRAAMRGVRCVIHCAVGPGGTNAEGTRIAGRAALEAGVDRFVHVSTIDVYGDALGLISEDTPLTRTGRPYGDSKIDAETVCEDLENQGLSVTIIRPTIVYGPFSQSWTIEFAERLLAPPWPFPAELSQGTCNLIYVDDLVYGMILALRRKEAVGEAFNLNGPERPTWHQYFVALNDALGLRPLAPSRAARSRVHAAVMDPVRAGAKAALRRFERPIRALYQRSAAAKRMMKLAERLIRRAPTEGEFRLYGKRLSVSTDKAARLLGYVPQTPMSEGVALSAAWLTANAFLRADSAGQKRPA